VRSPPNFANRIAETLQGEKAIATFACGGKLTAKSWLTSRTGADKINEVINLFYEGKDNQVHKTTFPAVAEQIEKLASDCDAATFGLGGEDKLDPKYRSGRKLDNTKFASSFNPFDYDNMELIKQILFSGAIQLGAEEPLITAELYIKLNVFFLCLQLHCQFKIYRGPHDKFKPHVDTPRTETQFGSLVVALPSAHTGGELAVRHNGREMIFNGREMIFDWNKDAESIQWAAFYSDCEHEVFPVTSGYRVILRTTCTTIIAEETPLIQRIWDFLPFRFTKSLSRHLRLSISCRKVRVIYIFANRRWCSWNLLSPGDYAHATNSPFTRLPGMMKGPDAAILAVCKALKLPVEGRPVYERLNLFDGYYEDEDEDEDVSITPAVELFQQSQPPPRKKTRSTKNEDCD